MDKERSNIAPFEDEWGTLLFVLQSRRKPALVFVVCDSIGERKRLYKKLALELSQLKFFTFDVSDLSVTSLYRTLKEKTPPELLTATERVGCAVNVFGVEYSLFDNAGKESVLVAEMNFERELLFREFPFNLLIWTNTRGRQMLQKRAGDLWDWVTYCFEFVDSEETLGASDTPELVEDGSLFGLMRQGDSRLVERSVRDRYNSEILRGKNLLQKSNFTEAVEVFKSVLNTLFAMNGNQMEFADAFRHLALALQGAGNLMGALEFFQKASKANSVTSQQVNQRKIFVELGDLCVRLQRDREALHAFKAALALFDTDDLHEKAQILHRLGEFYMKQGDHINARSYLTQAGDIFAGLGMDVDVEKTNLVLAAERMRMKGDMLAPSDSMRAYAP